MENQEANSECKSRLSLLNFNLKNEIFFFIPLNKIFEEVFYINKSCSFALKNLKRLNYIKNNLNKLIHNINFSKERTNEIKIKLENFIDQKEIIYEICAILLNKKHKKNSSYTFDGNTNLKKAVVFKFIAYNKYIKRLNMKNFNIQFKQKTTRTLLEGIFNCKSDSLQSLGLTNNKLGKNTEDTVLLKQILNKNSQIIELDLEQNDLGFFSSCDFKLLIEGLLNNNKINSLNLSGNYFGYNNENDMEYLYKFLKDNNSLRSIFFRNCSIGMNKNDIYYLNKIISKENSIVKEIDLSDNRLVNKDNFENLKNFFSAIAENKSILELNLSSNALCGKDNFYEINENNNFEIFGKKATNAILKDDIQENVFLHICEAIATNKYLVNLNLSNNNFGKDKRNLSLLKKAITQNKKLKKLILLNNYFESKDKQELKELIKKTNNKISLII